MPLRLQEIIHKYEEGAGRPVLKVGLTVVVFLALAVAYNLNTFRFFTNPEAMDAAQLARNLAEGKGYTTDFVRPISLGLLKKRTHAEPAGARAATNAVASAGPMEAHPDLANPPAYPLLLAGLMKVMPSRHPDLLTVKVFSHYAPDLWINGLNAALFLLAVALVFALARRLFDGPVAWVSVVVFMGADLFWRFSVSGLSTMLLVVIFLALVSVLARLEPAAREGNATPGKLLLLAAVAGLLVGAAALTRYSMAWLIVPVLAWLAFLPGPQRAWLALAAAGAFLVAVTPWVARNYAVSGTPFGTAGYAVAQGTRLYPENQLERSVEVELARTESGDYWNKLFANTREIVEKELPRLGGSWVTALFLAGLLMPFRNVTLSRLRWFLVSCLAVLTVAQALGKTALAGEVPEVNSENLLVVVAPLVFVYGVSLFFVLREQLVTQWPALRVMVLAAFCARACGPMFFTFLPPPEPYPGFYPPWIQAGAQATKERELIMTDIPWAVAWYGHRPSVWLSLKHKEPKRRGDFYEIHERFKTVNAIYLTSKTLKSLEGRTLPRWAQSEGPDLDWENFKKLAQQVGRQVAGANGADEALNPLRDLVAEVKKHWVRGAEEEWEGFVLGIFVKGEVPTGFPLKHALYPPGQEIFLRDSERGGPKTIQSSE